ncbi:MAG: RNA polymerase factor sigma-54 [Candidatus Cloacimonetes bacterium]|nr:RNA polymerase factor sigma-54 [Candidatus Cloacimonadota bacterium]
MNRMKVGVRTSQQMQQKLKLSPQMLITAELIQKPIQELEMVLKKELRLNPFLQDLSSEDGGNENPDIPDEMDEFQQSDDDGDLADQIQQLNKIINDIDDVSNEQFSYERQDKSRASRDNEEFETSKENIWDHFTEQVRELPLSPVEYDFADSILNTLDDNGYLDTPFEELYESYGLSEARAEQIHEMIMDIYPRGIGARNLAECLLAQLDNEISNHPVITSIIEDDLDVLQNHKFEELTKKYNISFEELITIKNIISHLDPKPRSRVTNHTLSYIKPDIIIKEIDGDLEIIVNDTYIPEIVVNKDYAQRILEQSKDKKHALRYIKSKLIAAENFVKALWMRRETLLRITDELIGQQPAFFREGKKILQPMTYEDVAKKIKRDVSTICRVVNNYYIETPLGVYLMKWFFTSKIGELSSQLIKKEIQKIIENENKKKPLSDQKIMDLLNEQGIEVSLRAVTKYRNQMGIPASRFRKKHL